MDVTRFLDLEVAPRIVFADLAARQDRARFLIPNGAGEWRAVTWAAYARLVREVASFLAAEGLQSGERAAVFAPNRYEWIATALGIQAAGGVMVPIYPSSTAEQAAYIVEHSDAKVVFVDTEPLFERIFAAWPAFRDVRRIVSLDDAIDLHGVVRRLRERGLSTPPFAEIEQKVMAWSRALQLGAARDKADHAAVPRSLAALSLEQVAIMLYTSGTSGPPKGVPLTHRNLAINTRDWLNALAPVLEREATDLLWLPMSHVFGYGEACIGNMLSFTSYLVRPEDVLAKLKEVRPQVLMSVPSYWEKIAVDVGAIADRTKRKERLLSLTGGNLKLCLSGGAGLKPEIKEVFFECGLLIIEGYGLTETSPTLTLNRPGAFRFDSVGKPLSSIEIALAPDGEILARGPSVFSGYHKDPSATQAAFAEDGWFKTGDVGRFTDDGFLQIVDRKKDILVTAGGKNIPPSNIEMLFRDDPLIAHLVVYGDEKRYLVAGVWLNEEAARRELADTTLATEALGARVQQKIDRANERLASFETIKRFRIMDTPLTVEGGFLTPTLKLRRKRVYEAFKEAFEDLYA